jgi:hypothetical protein
MKVDDFLWNMEALLNFKYGESDKPFSEIVSKEDVVEIPLNSEGKVNNSDLVAAVESIRRKVGEQWVSVNVTSKHVITIDLSLDKPLGQNLAASARFRIGTGVGVGSGPSGGGPAISDSGPFNEGESYYYGFGLKCNQTPGKDAAQRLSEEINYRFPTYAKYSGFAVSEELTYFRAFGFVQKEDIDRNNIRDSKLFYKTEQFPGFNYADLCINSSDMNYYYNNLDKILRDQRSFNGNLDFLCLFMKGEAHLHTENGVPHSGFHHEGYHVFGNYVLADCQRVCNPEPGIGGACFYTPCGY